MSKKRALFAKRVLTVLYSCDMENIEHQKIIIELLKSVKSFMNIICKKHALTVLYPCDIKNI